MLRIVRKEIISRQGKYPFALSSENMALESDILVKLESANALVGKRCTFGPNYQVSPTITKRQTFPESCSHWKVGKYALCFTLNIFPGTDPRFKEFKEVAKVRQRNQIVSTTWPFTWRTRDEKQTEREGKDLQSGNIASPVPDLTFANKIFCPWTKSNAFISYLV